MTLSITLVLPQFILQASDRRLTYRQGGNVASDEANKAVIIQCRDGTAAITFCGVGGFGLPQGTDYVGIDDWLAEAAQAAGVAELNLEAAAEFVRREATDYFTKRNLKGMPHAFVMTAWVDGEKRASLKRPRVWLVENADDSSSFGTTFAVKPQRSRPGSMVFAGAIGAVTRATRRRLQSGIRQAMSANQIVDIVVSTLRRASEESGGTSIGPNCLVVLLSRDGRCVTCSFDREGRRSSFGPHVLWATGARSFLAADPEASDSRLGVVLGTGDRQIQLLGQRVTARVSRTATAVGSVQVRMRTGDLVHTPAVASAPEPVIRVVALEDESVPELDDPRRHD